MTGVGFPQISQICQPADSAIFVCQEIPVSDCADQADQFSIAEADLRDLRKRIRRIPVTGGNFNFGTAKSA